MRELLIFYGNFWEERGKGLFFCLMILYNVVGVFMEKLKGVLDEKANI